MKFVRVALLLIGVLLIGGSSILTWVSVDVDLEAFGELSSEALESLEDSDPDAAEVIDDAADVIETARELVPDFLLDASINGLNGYDLLGFGLLILGLAIGAAIAGGIWALEGAWWLRWIGLFCAVLILLLVPLVVGSVLVADSLLEEFLPADWQPFSPAFAVTWAPAGSVGGAIAIVLALVGRVDVDDRAVSVGTGLPYEDAIGS